MIWNSINKFNSHVAGYYPDHKYPLLRYSVAKHAKKLLYGKGIDITTEDKEFKKEFTKWAEDHKLLNMLEKVEEICSLYGVAYIIYNNDDENPAFHIADSHMPIYPWFVDGKLVAVDMYIFKEQSRNSHFTRERYKLVDGKAYIERTGYKINEDGKGNVEMDWNAFTKMADNKEQEIVDLNRDTLPVYVVFNQNTYLRNPLMAWRLADGHNAQYLECDYINALTQRTKERMINKSMVFGRSNNENGSPFQQVCPHTGVIADGWVNEASRGEKGDTKIEIMSVASKLGDYQQDLDHIKESYFDECGYSFQQSGDQAGSDTATGQMIMKGKDIETTLNKRSIRTIVLNEMFQDIFGRDDFQFIINENISIDESALVETFVKAQTLGIMSRAEMRSKLMGITIEQAQEDLDAIDKETEERNEKLGLGPDGQPIEKEEGETDGDTAE